MASYAYNAYIYGLLDNGWEMKTSTYYVALLSSSYVYSSAHQSMSSSGLSGSECTGTGYSRKAITLSYSENEPGNTVDVSGTNVSWTSLTCGTVSGALILVSGATSGTQIPVCFVTDGGFPVTTNGGDLQINWNGNASTAGGIIKFSMS
jgi:hypothetical protein